MSERHDESRNLPASNEGSSPGAPPASAGEMPQRTELPSPPPKSVPPIPEGGVSWEERRKGLPPEEVENPEEQLYAERFASEEQKFNQPGPEWKPVEESRPAQIAPDWPPPLHKDERG